MSKLICTSAINGAWEVLTKAKSKLAEALAEKGADCPVGFPDTAYYLPIIYSFTGHKVVTLGDLNWVMQECERLLPQPPTDQVWLPYLGDTLDAGVATLFAFETIEACKYLIGPHPVEGIWLGAANDVIMRERGVEFVDGTAPGFAAVVGAAPNAEIAVQIARELQQKNLYVFMAGETDGITFAEQLDSEGVQLGWETRLVPFGRDISACVYALGFANRAALSFGGITPGDYERNLRYNKNRIFAFVMALGEVDNEKYAAAAGAINYGFPTIADTDIPEILPTGVCTYEHVVSEVPHDKIVERALEVRGCKIKVTNVPIPVPYGPAFEGERIRKNDVQVEFGGNRTTAFEYVTMVEMEDIEDGTIEIIGTDIDAVPEGTALPLAIWVEVAGRKMQSDFEPILERQIHHLLNGAEGIWHMGQRDIVWTRVSKNAFSRGVRLSHYGEIIHAKFLSEYPAIVDKVKVTLITDEEEVNRRVEVARGVYHDRNKRLESMTDESVDTFYSCLLCQSFAPDHVCVITPERLGLCGAYNWLDGKAAFEIDETGPNQPISKGECLDPVRGVWQGVNDYVFKHSHRSIESFTAYSIMDRPMTSCGCFETIIAYVPECNGVMVVNREFLGDTPVGMPFSSLAGSVGGGAQTPGFMGVGKAFLSSRKFLYADGGPGRVVWMPKELKDLVGAELNELAANSGLPDFMSKVADETIATDPDEIRAFMEKVDHPALNLPDMSAIWTAEEPLATTQATAPTPDSALTSPAPEPVAENVSEPVPEPVEAVLADRGVTTEDHAPENGKLHSPTVAATTGGGTQSGLSEGERRALIDEIKQAALHEVVTEIVSVLQDKFLGGSTVASPPAGPATAVPVPTEPAPEPVTAAPTEPVRKVEPERYAAEKLAGVTAFELPVEKPGELIEVITLGGAGRRQVVLGGQQALPFCHFEGAMPNSPAIALEVFDTVSNKTSPILREVWGDLLSKPVDMARKAVEVYGADLISVRLEGTHPEKGGKSPDEALELVQQVLKAIDVPVIVTTHNHFDSANEVMKRIAQACEGERLLLNWVEGDNYRTIAGLALAYDHCVVAQSPIDVNLAKQLNILLTNMDLPRDRIVLDPLASALGYGVEYTYSVMERIRQTALGGDTALAFPMFVHVGQEATKVKESSAPESDFPAWGDLGRRALLWEVQTAMPLVQAGADLLVVYHPDSLAMLQRTIKQLTAHQRPAN